ncbi:hypothetical protein [Streptomyces sp. NBC_01446]|nr:hypothetical protein [Streptomyces sp. NBC_01446]
MPEAGTQVPAPGVTSGEALEEAVLREVAEKNTGGPAATVVRQIAVEHKPHPGTGQPRRKPDEFLHRATHSAASAAEGLAYSCCLRAAPGYWPRPVT